MRPVRGSRPACAALVATAVGAAASALPAAAQTGGLLAPLGQASAWRPALLPQQRLPQTRFARVEVDGRPALRIEADASYGNLVHALPPAAAAARTLAWRWRVDRPLERADLHRKDGDDAAVKVCAMFDLPLDRLPFLDRQRLRLARAASGEALPAATLCYVWDATLARETLLRNAYTARLRWIVLGPPDGATARWQAERRDLAADFRRAFGDESEQVPPLVAVAVGADADNTGGHSLAHVADLELSP